MPNTDCIRNRFRAGRSGGHIARAFTLVELLVVIGIIALLIAILLPSLNVARQQAAQVKCLAQLQQLGQGFVMYINDNKGWMPSCDTCGPLYPANFSDPNNNENGIFPSVNANQTWVGWVDGGPTLQAIQNGTLYKYCKNTALYHCPSDTNEYRTRSYSINTFLATGDSTWFTTCLFKIFKITQVGEPSRTITFVEEPDPRATGQSTSNNGAYSNQWNLGGWYQNPAITDTMTNLPGPTVNLWGDVCASWHRGGANYGFADGHAEYWKYADQRTVNYLKNDPTWPSPSYSTPNDPDLNRIRQDICTWPQQRFQ
jgi:prepilin-type processing-associated H-X9-DG protein/prepilin-type N-terminal cleavage/methylation domain-containing protein